MIIIFYNILEPKVNESFRWIFKEQLQIQIECTKHTIGLKEKNSSKQTETKEQPNLSKTSKLSTLHQILTSIVNNNLILDCSIEVGPSTSTAIPKYCDITGYEVIIVNKEDKIQGQCIRTLLLR